MLVSKNLAGLFGSSESFSYLDRSVGKMKDSCYHCCRWKFLGDVFCKNLRFRKDFENFRQS